MSAERTTITNLSRNSHHITLVNSLLTLTGYQIFTNVDWVVNRDRLFKTFAVYTGREHVAKVSVVAFEGGTGGDYDVAIQRAFAQFEVDRLNMKESGFGIIMVGNPELFSKAGRYITLSCPPYLR